MKHRQPTRRRSGPGLFVLLCSGLLAPCLLAAPVSLDRAHFPAGGGTLRSSRFSVTGSIGQSMAATTPSTGTELAARAGFWSQTLRWLNAIPVPGSDLVERRAGQGAHVLVASLLANDRDGDWDRLSLLSLAGTSTGGGSLFRDGPWIVYLPPGGAGPATDSFTYQIADGLGGVATGTVVIQIPLPPLVSGSPLAIRNLPGPPAQVEVRFQGVAGRTYQVQTADAATGPWIPSASVVATTSGLLLFTEPPQAGPRFFRVIEP